MPIAARIRNLPLRSCFAQISFSLLQAINGKGEGLVIIKIYYNKNVAYLSAITHASSDSNQYDVRMNALYAHNLGLRDGDQVFVEAVRTNQQACIRANLEPVSVDDWEILELHAEQVEGNVLDQVRILWPGQVFPLWVDNGAVCIFMKTVDTTPAGSFVVLTPLLTDLMIAPKIHQPNTSFHPAAAADENMDAITAPQPCTTGADAIQPTDILQKIADLIRAIMHSRFVATFKVVILYLPRMIVRLVVRCYAAVTVTRGARSRTLQVAAKLVAKVSTSAEMIEKLTSLPASFDFLMRVEQDWRSCCDEDMLTHDQPASLLLHMLDLESSINDDECEIRIVRITRLPSPKEKKSKDNNLHKNSVAARLYIHPLTDLTLPMDWSRTSANYQLKVGTFIRRQLNMSVTSQVRLERIDSGVLSDCSKLRSVTVTVERKAANFAYFGDDGRPDEQLAVSFHRWLASYSDSGNPLPVCVGTLLAFRVEEEEGTVECRVTQFHPAPSNVEQTYLLSSDDLNTLKINFQLALGDSEWPPTVVDDERAELVAEEAAGFKQQTRALVHFAELALAARPLASALMVETSFQSRCALVVGPKGSGKSTLCRSIMHKFATDPAINAYTRVIDCSTLRGKKSTVVFECLNDAYEECLWRQPSILLLDELDGLVSNTGGGGADPQIYDLQLATIVATLIKQLAANPHARILAIMTARARDSIHPFLTKASGSHHLFSKLITLTLPDAEQREAIIKSLLGSSRVSVNMDEIVARTEGYAPIDLKYLVYRAHHAARSRSRVEQMTSCDLVGALEGFVPSTLHNVKLHKPNTSIDWTSIGGLQSVKRLLAEQLLWPLKYKHLFDSVGMAGGNSGVLLYGPSGCGKTLVASAVANQCKLNFISVKGPELLSKYIGASEAAVRDLFSRANAAAPCVLFFDEFDSLAPKRGHDSTGVTDRVVNQLLTHLDGVEPLEGVTVLAATNRPDLIDPALLRPGRLDHHLYCPLPDENERLDILRVFTANIQLDDDVDLAQVARASDGFTGADIKSLLYNAQLDVVHERRRKVVNGDHTQEVVFSSPNTGDLEVEDIYLNNDFNSEFPLLRDDESSFISTKNIVNDVTDTAAALLAASVTSRCAAGGGIATSSVGDFSYLPSLAEGFQNNVPASVTDEVSHLLASHREDEEEEDSGVDDEHHRLKIRICRNNLKFALSTTRPSLSEEQRHSLDEMYLGFKQSREKGLDKKEVKNNRPRATLS